MFRFFQVLLLTLISSQVLAWENHALLTKIVLDDWLANDSSTSAYLNQTVKPESLKSFLNATKATLPSKMLEIEKEARSHENGYKPLPDHLIYQPSQSACSIDIETCFKKSLRMNLDVPLLPMVYDSSGFYSHQRGFKPIVDPRKMMPAYIAALAAQFKTTDFTVIPANGRVRIADIISTGSIQPDFGFDSFLYEDSQTSFGKIYGFGTQPMGNPQYPSHSQMLFHMSAYHDDPKILTVIPRLNENYPEYRAYLFLNLSRFAAENNHPYWSALFLGWALHYLQDMTQPYHSKIAYGLDTNRVIQAIMETAKNNFKPFSELETLQVNRHVILENLTNHILTSSENKSVYKKILYRSLIDRSLDPKIPPCDLNALYLRNQVSAKTADITPDYQTILQDTIPSAYINNSEFNVLSAMNFNKLFLHKMSDSQRLHFSEAVAKSLRLYGAYTRACIAAYGKM